MFRAIIFSVLLGLAATGAAAQGNRPGGPPPQGPPQGPFKWWQADETKAQLALTNDQSAKIEEVWQAAIPRLRAAGEDIDRYDKQLSKLLSANETTELDVIKGLNLVQVARNEWDRQRTLMLFRMQRVLTYDQRMKLKSLREKWEQERGRGRRGDPPARPTTIRK